MLDFRTRPRTTLAAAIAAAALVGAGGGAATYAALAAGDGEPAARTVTVGSDASPVADTSGGLSVADIYKRSAASVVEIAVTSSGEGPFGGQGRSQGSGFVYDDEGHVITNQHVVAGATEVTVKLSDGSTYDGTVVGTDPSTDLAVVKVDAPAAALEPLELADSDELEVGDGVVAIGSPFGLAQTVTTGIVSALHRQITAPNDFSINDAIQTDAAINHGNSGGPLLDLEGRVVGVNSQIESQTGGNDGIGFAVPSTTVEKIAAQLIADGEVEHAYLGIGVATVTEPAAEELDLPVGVQVTNVRPDTPAAEAELEAGSGERVVDGQVYATGGDVITEIDGDAVRTAEELQRVIDARSPGDTIELTVVRDGRELSVDVTLASRPA
jgi:putative serine protease PepD